jgi:hypothetical protein
MQFVSCLVHLNNDITFTREKADVSVAEVRLLEAIHGPGSVRNIKATRVDSSVSQASERARLTELYGMAKDHDDNLIFKQVYPGFSPLPTRLSDIAPEPEAEEAGLATSKK